MKGSGSPATAPGAAAQALADEIGPLLRGRPRRLPAHALYDALGSALFDAICHLPWYPITRAETGLLRRHRRAILRAAGDRVRIVELGPGNGEKLATLLQEPLAQGAHDVHLVDVSASALEAATSRLHRLPHVSVTTHVARYQDGLRQLGGERACGDAMLVCLLGSNIGNFDPHDAQALLGNVRQALRGADTLLIGADLVKPVDTLLAAYDDPLGVTAAFTRNVLVRLNRELGADFDVAQFVHDARWNADASRMEMHLVSLRRQRVHVPAADLVLHLEAGESIWTESSYKYEIGPFTDALSQVGFAPAAQWVDSDGGFLLVLATAR